MKSLHHCIMILICSLFLISCSSLSLKDDEMDTVNKQWIAAEVTWQRALEKVNLYVDIMNRSQKDTLRDAILTVKKARTTFNTYRSVGDITKAETQVQLLKDVTDMIRSRLLRELMKENSQTSSFQLTFVSTQTERRLLKWQMPLMHY